MIKKQTLLIMLVSFLLLNQPAFSNNYECGDSIKEIESYLKLDKKQISKIDPLLKRLKQKTHYRANEIRSLNKKIDKQSTTELMNEVNVNALIDRKAKLISDIIKLKVNVNHKIYMLLKKDQKNKYQKLMQNCHEKMAYY